MSFSVHVNEMEAFPLLALKGILDATGELTCDIELHNGEKLEGLFVYSDDNPGITQSARLVTRTNKTDEPKSFEWDDIKLITVN